MPIKKRGRRERYAKPYKEGVWNHEKWAGWEDLPSIFQATLIWAFITSSPENLEEQLRLMGADLYGANGPAAIVYRETGIWMYATLAKLWEGILIKEQLRKGIGYFFAAKKEEGSQIYASAKSSGTWRAAEKKVSEASEIEKLAAGRFLIPREEDPLLEFGVWLSRAAMHLECMPAEIQDDFEFYEISFDSELPPKNPPINVLRLGERRIVIDAKSTSVIKTLHKSEGGILYGFQVFKCEEEEYSFYPFGIGYAQIRKDPLGGQSLNRPHHESSKIGGICFNCKGFREMILGAFSMLFSKDQNHHSLLPRYAVLYAEHYGQKEGDVLAKWGLSEP
jgi:hypothetical protein